MVNSIFHTTLRAFHGDPAIKEALLRQLRAHRQADEIVKGQYWEGGKGCAVGCTVHSSNHMLYERLHGTPEVLARLEGPIFEGLSNAKYKEFPIAFIEAIPVGSDLSLAWPLFAVSLMEDAAKYDETRFCQAVADLYKRIVAGGAVPKEEWLAACDADADYADAVFAAEAATEAATATYAWADAAEAACAACADAAGAWADAEDAEDAWAKQSSALINALKSCQ